MKIEPYLATNCSQWCIDYVDIARRSSATGRQTRVGRGKQAIFVLNAPVSQKRHWR